MERSDMKDLLDELEETIEGYEDEDGLDPDDQLKMEDDIDSYRSRFIEITESESDDGALEFADECLEELKNIEDAVREANLKKFLRGLKKIHHLVRKAYTELR